MEADFLRAMWEFDRNFTVGLATQGDNQNGKGDFFTDLIALLLESSTGRPLYGRGAVPGLFFGQHNLDASYPPRGQVEILIETKVAGAPKTGRNPAQRNPLGRPGSSDLKKRITEAGLKTIEFAHAAEKMMDAVGVLAYEPDPGGDRYRVAPVPISLELDRILTRAATALRSQPPWLDGEARS